MCEQLKWVPSPGSLVFRSTVYTYPEVPCELTKENYIDDLRIEGTAIKATLQKLEHFDQDALVAEIEYCMLRRKV